MTKSSFSGFSAPKPDTGVVQVGVFTAGDDVSLNYSSTNYVYNSYMTKCYTYTFGKNLCGTVRVKFQLFTSSSTSTIVYGQVYKNGVPVGILRTYNSTSSYIFSPIYAEDIAISGGDTIEFWAYTFSGVTTGLVSPTISVSSSGNTGFISFEKFM